MQGLSNENRMTTPKKAEEAFRLLTTLRTVLESQQEKNWHLVIKAAIAELTDTNGQVISSGFDNARSIYNTMTSGGRGFSEYFVWVADEEKRIQINQELDKLRTEIWKIFND